MQLIFIRHAEKNNKDLVNLSKQGVSRAKELTRFFINQINYKIEIPEVIVAMKQHNKHSSNRSFETISDLAETLSLNIVSDFKRDDTKDLIKFLNNQTTTTLVVFEHKKLIEMVIKMTGLKHLTWDSDNYSDIIVLENNSIYIYNSFEINSDNEIVYPDIIINKFYSQY